MSEPDSLAILPHSLPALTSLIAQPETSWPCHSIVDLYLHRPFVPAYRAPEYGEQALVARRIANGVAILAERLRRFSRSYPHWHRFDPAPYFDLFPDQAAALVRIDVLGATLDITIYADMLSPAFRRAERFWAQAFCPAWFASGRNDAFDSHFYQHTLPAMQRRLQEARAEIAQAGDILYRRDDITFLASSAALDERAAHQHRLPADDKAIRSLFHHIPTLTLRRSYDILEVMQEK